MTIHTPRLAPSILAAALLATLSACAPKTAPPTAAPSAAAPAVDTSKDVDAIRAWVNDYNADYKAHAVDKLLVESEPGVMGYVPGVPVQKGPGDANPTTAEFAGDPAMAIKLNVDRAEVSKAGDLGYAIGSFQRTATNAKTHKVEQTSGGYVLVLRKQADGSWKLAAYSASPGPSKS